MIKEYEDGIKWDLHEDHFNSAGQTVSVICSKVKQNTLQDHDDCLQNDAKKFVSQQLNHALVGKIDVFIIIALCSLCGIYLQSVWYHYSWWKWSSM